MTQCTRRRVVLWDLYAIKLARGRRGRTFGEDLGRYRADILRRSLDTPLERLFVQLQRGLEVVRWEVSVARNEVKESTTHSTRGSQRG
jgi:hypothetical protein